MKHLVFIVFLILSVFSCRNNKVEIVEIPEPYYEIYRFVSAIPSLRLRDNPSQDGEKIGSLPYGSKVRILQITGGELVIEGERGYWTEIMFEELSGWVFGGFLSPVIPNWFEKLAEEKKLIAFWTSDIPFGGQYFHFRENNRCSIGIDSTEVAAGGKYEISRNIGGSLSITAELTNSIILDDKIEPHPYTKYIKTIEINQYSIILAEYYPENEISQWKEIGLVRGGTPLNGAIVSHDYDKVDELLDYWNIDYYTPNSRSALFTAADTDNPFILELLLSRGANVNLLTYNGNNGLHEGYNFPNNIIMLIRYGADINGQNKSMDTPLHYAIMTYQMSSVKTYIKYGADPTIKNDQGLTALELAQEVAERDWIRDEFTARMNEIVILLEEYTKLWHKNKIKPVVVETGYEKYIKVENKKLE